MFMRGEKPAIFDCDDNMVESMNDVNRFGFFTFGRFSLFSFRN